jgi:endoglucanase
MALAKLTWNKAGVNIGENLLHWVTVIQEHPLKEMWCLIAGFDFACADTNNDAQYTASNIAIPLASYGGADGIGQMNHFHSQYGLNVFRLPVCWQYLVNGDLGGELDYNGNFGIYDQLVQGCLATGAYCVIDIHNYARWNGQIVGQSNGAVTNEHLASLWQQM